MRTLLRAVAGLCGPLLLLILIARSAGPLFSDGVLAFAISTGGPLNVAVMDRATGLVYMAGDPAFANYHPSWSPDGRWLSFKSITERTSARSERGFVVLDMHTGQSFTTRGFSDGDFSWAPDSQHMVYYDTTRLYLLHIATEKSVALVRNADSAPAGYAWAPDGSTVSYVVAGNRLQNVPVYAYDIATREDIHLTDIDRYNTLHRWSPDGRYILFDDGAIPDTLPSQLLDIERGTLTEPNMPRNAWAHVWSPDSSEITYIIENGTERSSFITYRYALATDEAHPERNLPLNGFQTPYWSSNGRYIARYKSDGSFTVVVADVQTGATSTHEQIRFMRWHPDGEHMLLGNDSGSVALVSAVDGAAEPVPLPPGAIVNSLAWQP
ncbi:MAG: hypothetical protein AAF787_18190 [Chloroflexota bacterium]